MSEVTDLTVIEIKPEQAPVLYVSGGLDAYLEQIRQAVNEVPDLSTKKGRDRVASLAGQVSRSKTAIEKPGREYLKRLKEAVRPAEAEIKRFVDACDELRDATRLPLTEWEAEQDRIKAEEAMNTLHSEALEMNIKFDHELAAKFEADHEMALLMNKDFDRDAKEKAEEAERQRIAREEELKRQAAEQAKRDLEEKAERERAEAARREAEEAKGQPEITSMGNGIFSIGALLNQNTSNEVEKTENAAETTSDVQMETTQPEKVENTDPVQLGEGTNAAAPQAVTVAPAEILAAAAPSLANQEQASVDHKTDSPGQNSEPAHQNEPGQAHSDPEPAQSEPEVQQGEPAVEYPAYFEPGRYEGLPNEVYHAANGISSTQVKDARVSLMYFNARHVEKTIVKERSAVLDMGNLVHALALQPEQLDAEFSVEPVIPEGAFTMAATLRAFIDEHNVSLPPQLSADDIKVLLEEYNATLPPQVPLGANLEETAQNYMALPADFQRIDGDQKQTATAMKACIKEYNAILPMPVKTSGSRDALLEQLAIINPDLVAQEAQKPAPLKVSGTKADMIQAVKSVKPDAMFADELLDAWRDNPEGKVLVTRQQLSTALNIQKALLAHPTAGMLLTHPSRAVEVSYFGFDEETGLEVRVRPDLEIDLDGVRIGADLKTISMWNVKQESLRARLHREIIERDYHLSAAMYCETAALDQFFWIFVNKDENYHWIAIIEASAELLELGMLEYRKAMRAIATGFDTGEWPAPIIDDYTDELNDFDLRRLEALRTQA